jgi:hypothetical protein
MKKNYLILLALFLVVNLTGGVFAFGVASLYHRNNPLIMEKGETVTVQLNLQNMRAVSDVNAILEILEGEEIATLPQKEILVKANTSDTIAPLIITLPQDAKDSYNVRVRIRNTPDGASHGVSMGVGMVVGFDVLIAEQPAKEFNLQKYLVIVLSSLGLLLLILLFIKKFPKKKKHRR